MWHQDTKRCIRFVERLEVRAADFGGDSVALALDHDAPTIGRVQDGEREGPAGVEK